MIKFSSLAFILFFSASILIPQSTNKEFRSTWVITWEYINGGSSVEQNKARIRKILDDHVKANMTSVLWQVRQAGTAYYNSSYEPWGEYAGSSYPGFDPLAYATEEAHIRGLELHAWFNVFASQSTAPGAPANEHPEWVCRDASGIAMTTSRALSPGMETCREYLLNVAMEVVRNYDIDGIHLDYARWNEYSNSDKSERFANEKEEQKLPDWAISDEQIKDLEENKAGRYLYDVDHPFSAGVPAGFSSWDEWWRFSVTEYVRKLHDSIQTAKPWVRLSVAALGKYNWSGWQGYGTVYQDAALWFNEGYIDQLTPMHYHWTTGTAFYGMLAGSCPSCWSQFIQPGIAAGRLYSVGPPSYILKDDNIFFRHAEIVSSSRAVNWVDGFQFFSYGSWRDMEYWETAAKTFFNRKTKVRGSGLISDSIPQNPSLTIQKIDSLNYNLTITPPAGTNTNQWFVLYRFINDSIITDQDEIVALKFGSQPFTIEQQFDGLQDYNGQFKFAATMLNRYWNESLPSNIVVTDSIPSFAPVVLSSLPSEGDTASANTSLSFTFSKTMDINSFPVGIEINPPIELSNGIWSNDYKKITFTTAANFSFSTNYTVTLDTSVKDINGNMIDGNGDGVPGDPFTLHFIVEDQDNTGPDVLAVYISDTLNFDPEDIAGILFTEEISSSTITHNNVILSKDDAPVAKAFHLKTANGRSILNLKTQLPLEAGETYKITLTQNITDLLGNPMAQEKEINFTTSLKEYIQKTIIDDFSSEGNWEQPGYSGSTAGIVDSGTYFGLNTLYIVPAASAASAYIQYQWDSNASMHLLREYLSGGAPRNVEFDTSFVLQVYIFGDNSGSQFRFALDEGNATAWPNHEVSNWITIDWYGWKLVEWKLNDPATVGIWGGLGNGMLDGTRFRIDSFQMTRTASSSNYGRIYLGLLRLAKKQDVLVSIKQTADNTPTSFELMQNYPNPFNPTTKIRYSIPLGETNSGASVQNVVLKVYDVLGNEVVTLVDEFKPAGNYEVEFNANRLASGVYFYRLTAGSFSDSKKLTLLK